MKSKKKDCGCGKMRTKRFDVGGEVDPPKEKPSAREFLTKWMESPMYQRMMSGEEDVYDNLVRGEGTYRTEQRDKSALDRYVTEKATDVYEAFLGDRYGHTHLPEVIEDYIRYQNEGKDRSSYYSNKPEEMERYNQLTVNQKADFHINRDKYDDYITYGTPLSVKDKVSAYQGFLRSEEDYQRITDALAEAGISVEDFKGVLTKAEKDYEERVDTESFNNAFNILTESTYFRDSVGDIISESLSSEDRASFEFVTPEYRKRASELGYYNAPPGIERFGISLILGRDLPFGSDRVSLSRQQLAEELNRMGYSSPTISGIRRSNIELTPEKTFHTIDDKPAFGISSSVSTKNPTISVLSEEEYKKALKLEYPNLSDEKIEEIYQDQMRRTELEELSHSSDSSVYTSYEGSKTGKAKTSGDRAFEIGEINLIPLKDRELMESSKKQQPENLSESDKTYIEYVSDPSETRARLNRVRMEAKESGIYDPFTETLDEKSLNKMIKESKKDPTKYRALQDLLKVYGEDGILMMMNEIAAVPQENVQMASQGMRVIKRQA
jgi:hypothetical protein